MTAGERTKRAILEMGVRLWRAGEPITTRRIARELDMTHGTVSYHFTRGEHSLRDAIAYYAVEQGDEKIIASLILENHKAAAHFSEAQRLEWMKQATCN